MGNNLEATLAGPPAPRSVTRLLDAWHQAECWLAVAAFTFVAAMVAYDVIARQFLGPLLIAAGVDPTALTIRGSQKMAVYAMIVGAFCGIGIATAVGAQMVPKVAFGLVPARWSMHVDRIADALTCGVLLCASYFAIQFVLSSKASGMLSSGGVEIEAWIIQLIVPLGLLSAALRYAVFAIWPAARPTSAEFVE
jgi:TRAP-type C4-dicarboxylate transport system permease small subunit